jgi:hypothetical protein
MSYGYPLLRHLLEVSNDVLQCSIENSVLADQLVTVHQAACKYIGNEDTGAHSSIVG